MKSIFLISIVYCLLPSALTKPGRTGCPPGQPMVYCFANPCIFMAQNCPNAARCETDACNTCKPIYYDRSGKVMKPHQCLSVTTTLSPGTGCPPGVPVAMCFMQPCLMMATNCPNAARCADNYCGGCYAIYYDANGVVMGPDQCEPITTTVSPTTDTSCPPDEPLVNCFVQPCARKDLDCPNAATCVDDYCGGCNAIYYDANGQVMGSDQCDNVPVPINSK